MSGSLQGIVARLSALDGVTDVQAEENRTSDVVNGVDPHSLWFVVEGGSDAAISRALVELVPLGCGLSGALEFDVPCGDWIRRVRFSRPIGIKGEG